MKLAEHLNQETRKMMDTLRKRKKPPSNKMRKEKFNNEKVNWLEIMGMYKDKYKRTKGGAIRRK